MDFKEVADVNAGKKQKIGAVCLNGQCEKRELSFEEILLDETLVQGEVWVLQEALRNAGGMNYRLRAKQNYELLIRIAKDYTVLQLGQEAGAEELPKEAPENWLRLEPEADGTSDSGDGSVQEGLKTDCYLIGRYREELLSMGSFDSAVLGILSAGREDITQYLEQMIAGTNEFYDIYDCTQPILIYTGSDVCYNILDIFAGALADALEEMGQRVEYYDIRERQIAQLDGYMRQRFKAVIGVQTYMFSVKRKKGGFAHDEISAPKYHFWLDHPIRGKDHLYQVPRGLCILTPDGNYAKFIRDYYGHPARFLPPAGCEKPCKNQKKDYGLVFIGSYCDGPMEDLRTLRKMSRKECYLVNRYILYMRRDLNITPEKALKKALEYYGITCSKEEFTEILYRERWVICSLPHYYRNKIIELLLKEGITLHVFGDTWKSSPMWGHPGLIHHEAVTGEDALEVYARSKLSLNIMSWHKDGFTERIANSMLQKAVVVTDRTTYLEENFVDGKDLLLFDLGHPEELPGRIKELLANEEKRKQMAENGCRKARSGHTWRQRAEKILEYIEEDRELLFSS